MADTNDAIDNIARGEYSAFNNAVTDMLMDRLKDRIDNEKVAVGMSMYQNNEEDYDLDDVEYEEPEFEEGTDEEV
jgi:hypothetical protein